MKTFRKTDRTSDSPYTCPACGQPVSDVRYVYGDEAADVAEQAYFYRCRECSFIFARPVPIQELDQRRMDGVDNAEMFNSKVMKWLYVSLFIRQEIRRIKKYTSGNGTRLLDVGCGTGWTSKVYKDNGFDVTGLEPSKVRAEIARERYGIEIINEYLENVPDNVGRYDVIVLRHIIEHFEDPAAIMQKVRDLLNDNGIVVIVVPNINCLGRYIFETDWTWVLPWHCNFFTPKSSRVFLERLGFHVLSQYQTPSPLYFPDSLLRMISNPVLTRFIGKYRVAAMLASAPIAVVGALLSMGDNLNLFACKSDNITIS